MLFSKRLANTIESVLGITYLSLTEQAYRYRKKCGSCNVINVSIKAAVCVTGMLRYHLDIPHSYIISLLTENR